MRDVFDPAKVVTALLALVLGVGWVFFPGQEIFPFASWTMFSRLQNEARVVDVRVTQCTGLTVDEPTLARDLPELAPKFRSVVLRTVLLKFAKEVRENSSSTGRYRKMAEEILFDGRHCTYALVDIRFEPVEMLRDGVYTATELGRFETTGR